MMQAILALTMALMGDLQSADGLKSGYVEPAPAQDPDRPPLPAADLRALREYNIFAPSKIVRKEHKPSTPVVKEKKLARPTPPLLTGIILDPAARAYQAVVEDRNKYEKLKLLKAPLFLKAGDEFLVYRIETVSSEKGTIKYGESSKDLKVGDTFPDAGLKAPEGVEISEESADVSPDTKSEPKSEAKAEAKPESKASDSSSSSTKEEDKKNEDVLKRLRKGKNRDYGP